MRSNRRVYVVDPDPEDRANLAAMLEAAGFTAEVYGSAQEFLTAPSPAAGSCILLDVSSPDMSGTELQRMLGARGLPVIMVTSQATVATAVQAMKDGAVDFLEKPLRPEAVLEAVSRALTSPAEPGVTARIRAEFPDRLAALSERERTILSAIQAGGSSKEIARRLAISPRTVDVHRGNILRKLGVPSVSEAIRLLLMCEDLDRRARPTSTTQQATPEDTRRSLRQRRQSGLNAGG